MFTNTFTIILLLLYFWWITSSPSTPNISKPTHSALEPAPKPPTTLLKAPLTKFQFFIDYDMVWKDELPENYNIFNGQFSKLDACHGQLDGAFVPAQAQELYEHVQQNKFIAQTFKFETNSNFIQKDKNPFYFSCQQGHIHQAHMCPPGQFFQISTCHNIDQCAGQKDGQTFADPNNIQSFFECHQEVAISKDCPPDQFFILSHCFENSQLPAFCHLYEQPRKLDNKTLVVCRDGKITYEVCSPGYRLFDSLKCEPETCVNYPDGFSIALPNRQIGPLSFSPGYLICEDDKISETYTCPPTWDTHFSKGDNLTHLPQVFDGEQCTIPEFCVNVTSSDPDVIVPVHEFTKHVRNWVYSNAFDRTNGYRCEGSTRKRVAVDAGQIIHPKRLKTESACDGSTERAIVANTHIQYYNCKTDKLEICPQNNQFFDGHECRNNIPFAFEYDNLPLFRFDSLRENNWMEPWDYDPIKKEIPICIEPESKHIHAYNVCAHPDCAIYPWLTQISYQVRLRDEHLCTFDKKTNLIKKKLDDGKYLYWSQREIYDDNISEDCIPGQNIQSGHFVFDKTIFATCDESQPFVFCPSSSTKGIYLLSNTTGKSVWACVPPEIPPLMRETILANTRMHFAKNEVKKLYPEDGNEAKVLINGILTTIGPLGLEEKNSFKLETMGDGVEVEYEYRTTHPPDVAWPDHISKFGGAFLTKMKDFTIKPVKIINYEIKDAVTDFKLESEDG